MDWRTDGQSLGRDAGCDPSKLKRLMAEHHVPALVTAWKMIRIEADSCYAH